MKVPMQSLPVQRAAVSYSPVGGGLSPSIYAAGNGVVASCDCGGVDPSVDWGKLLGDVAKVAVPALTSLI